MRRGLKKEDSQAIKGIAIWLMLIHHLFYSTNTFRGMEVEFLVFDIDTVFSFAQFSKICVPLFAFVTAYGLAIKYKTEGFDRDVLQRNSIKRYFNLMVPFWFVFVIAQVVCNIAGERTFSEIYGNGHGRFMYFLLDACGIAYYMDTPTLNATWWYMSVALLIIFICPLIWKCVNMAGIIVFIGGFLFFQSMDWPKLILVAVMAVTMCEMETFETIDSLIKQKRFVKILLFLTAAAVFFACWFLYEEGGYEYIVYCLAIFAVAFAQQQYFSQIKPLTAFLSFWGKHSMNIFLVHTFIYAYLTHDFVYSFRYGILIFAVTLLLSLAASIMIEFLKKILKIDKLMLMINRKIYSGK